MVDCRFPYGWLCLTIVYVLVLVIVEFATTKDCLDEPCNSEGVDNSILGWSTDFFIATCFFAFGFHLSCCSQRQQPRGIKVYRSATMTQICMGFSYILGGLGHSIYANTGFDDGKGNQEFYICWALSFTFLTLAVIGTYAFVKKVQNQYLCSEGGGAGGRVGCCTKIFLPLSLVLVILSWIAIVAGYGWCAAEDDIHVDGVIDEFPALDQDEEILLSDCLQVGAAGEVAWYCTYSLFWIPVGIVLRQATLENGDGSGKAPRVYGVSTSVSSIWLIIIPWTFGIMLIVWSILVSVIRDDEEKTQFYEDIYGAVVYHYGMLLSFFFLHNIALVLPHNETQQQRQQSTTSKDQRGHINPVLY